jgi:hypothetical protein
LDAVDSKLLLKQELYAFEMNYLKEVSLHDTIQIEKTISENNKIFTVSKEGKICFALELNF